MFKIRVLEAICVGGKRVEPDEVVRVAAGDVLGIIEIGRGKLVDDDDMPKIRAAIAAENLRACPPDGRRPPLMKL
jgi:hypothetical protein